MEALAKELNQILEGSIADKLMSDLGKRMFFPKGIVAQAAEAGSKAKKYNATVGMATSGRKPMFLASIMQYFNRLDPDEIFSYAPTAGIAALRDMWKVEMVKKNPSLSGKLISKPLVTSGLTHGISLISDLFLNKGDEVIVSDMYWGNYKLIFEGRREAVIKNYPFFENGRISIDAVEKAVKGCSGKKAAVILNFPNNPAGYSPTREEADNLVSMFKKLAEDGYSLLVICDDAYYGLFFEDDIEKESLFSKLCDLHENILAVKIDGATKEELVWGFRIGFITYGAKGLKEEHYDALIKKTMGALRSSVSSCSNISQNLLIKGLQSGSYQQEKIDVADIMQARYLKVKEVTGQIPEDVPLRALPFNSGYFMTFEVKGKDAEELRLYLLDKYSTGTISIAGKYLRVAFSSVEVEEIPDLFKTIFNAAKEC